VTIEAELIDTLIEHQEANSVFLATATDPNPILCGYCVGALDALGCADQIPAEVLSRTETIEHCLGCVCMEIRLGEYAALCNDRHGEHVD